MQLAFEQLKNKLSQEDLFDLENKKPIPQFPSKIAVITSQHGAALQDFLKTTKNIFFAQDITIYPCLVQGDRAPNNIAQKITQANSHGDYDLLVVARGGGSLEDLWAFNEEMVARAIYDSKIPIISAVGHEIDYTISDFVADMRAVTPTAAAEIISKGKYHLRDRLAQWDQRMINSVQGQLERIKNGLKNASADRLIHFIKNKMTLQNNRIIRIQKDVSVQIAIRCRHALHRYQNLIDKLDALSPLKVLNRGYSVVKDKDNKVLKDAKNAAINDELSVTYHNGRHQVKVLKIYQDK